MVYLQVGISTGGRLNEVVTVNAGWNSTFCKTSAHELQPMARTTT